MTDPKVKPPPPASDKEKTVSEADVNKLKSAYDTKLSNITKQLEKVTEDLTAKEAELAEKDVASDDPEAVEALRAAHVELTKKYNAATKDLKALQTKNDEFTMTSERSRLAKEYEIDEEKITGDTVEEMTSSAKDAKIAKLQEGPGAPDKEQHEVAKVVGAGGEETPRKKGWQHFADATREAKEEKEAGSK